MGIRSSDGQAKLDVGDDCLSADIRDLRPEEEIAREVVGPYMTGELIAVPDPPDFMLCRDGGVAGWVEVTTAVNAESRAMRGWLSKNGWAVTSDRLTRDWWITFRKNAKLKNLDRERLIESLLVLEENVSDAGREVIEAPWPDGTQQDLDQFGVWFLVCTPVMNDVATLYLDGPPFSSSVGTSLITDLAMEKAEAKAYSLKGLEGERHLVVLVDYDWPDGAGLVLDEPNVPDEVPELPEEVTDIWLAAVKSLVWHFARGAEAWDVISAEGALDSG